MLDVVREKLLSKKAEAEFHAEVQAAIAEQQTHAREGERPLLQRIRMVENKIAKLVDAVAAMGFSEALRARLAKAETGGEGLLVPPPAENNRLTGPERVFIFPILGPQFFCL